MKPLRLLLVKPPPPEEVQRHACPTPEAYRYEWEPVALMLLADAVRRAHGDAIRVELWHLMDAADEARFVERVRAEPPAIVAFGEIDLLVNAVSRCALAVKRVGPEVLTVVGGKQTTLLRRGDRFPFEGIDLALRGDGAGPLVELVARLLAGDPGRDDLAGAVQVGDDGRVMDAGELAAYPARAVDGIGLRSTPVEGHPLGEYLARRNKFPSLVAGGAEDVRAAPVLFGVGCVHSCTFCQSPLEAPASGERVWSRDARSVAEEIAWLAEAHGVNSIFSLEANLDLANLRAVYAELAALGIDRLATSGFVRAADVARAARRGLLRALAAKGLRTLSIGIDVPPNSQRDVYRKGFSFQSLVQALEDCQQLGILVSGTVVGDPTLTRDAFAAQLAQVGQLPLASVDIRLAIALRGTAYFKEMEPYLIRHPDRDRGYFDRQNYRYQTLQLPGRIEPDETYRLVADFYRGYLDAPAHGAYVARLRAEHPDTGPFFERQRRAHAAMIR